MAGGASAPPVVGTSVTHGALVARHAVVGDKKKKRAPLPRSAAAAVSAAPPPAPPALVVTTAQASPIGCTGRTIGGRAGRFLFRIAGGGFTWPSKAL